jgi:hypothetical protein
MRAATCRPIAGGQRKSCAPEATRAGAWIASHRPLSFPAVPAPATIRHRQVTELQTAIAAYEEKLARTIPTDGLGEHALAALGIFRDRLAGGEGIREAALGTAGYNSLDVEAAMAKQNRHEMRAFETLLARFSWRRRLVLWLTRSD